MNILLLGSGGREHALAYYISQSSLCDQLYIAPGNSGTEMCGKNVELDILDFPHIANFCQAHDISLMIVGPEDPLVLGIVDYFRSLPALAHVRIIGPDAAGARLEGSKAYAKNFMKKYKIPTADYKEFETTQKKEALDYIRHLQPPIVIKADGLAAGKGVIIAQTYQEAEHTIKEILENNIFGEAGHKIVIEEFLDGIEMSCFVLTDGHSFYLLPDAKDYKRIGDGDTGPNTGGMGAISPVPFVDDDMRNKILSRIIEPTLQGLQSEGIRYSGFIFFGLINVEGNPKVIEYNCRLGDPETEVILNRIENDLVELLWDTVNNTIDNSKLKISTSASSTVILVSEGYPGPYIKGRIISGFDLVTDGLVFHAGAKREGSQVVTNGGRVIACSALSDNLQNALKISYENAKLITFDGKTYRNDIGFEF